MPRHVNADTLISAWKKSGKYYFYSSIQIRVLIFLSHFMLTCLNDNALCFNYNRNILEKYSPAGISLMGGSRAPAGMMVLDKKEVLGLLNLVRSYQ